MFSGLRRVIKCPFSPTSSCETAYRPLDVDKNQECYDDAMNAADEHGIIHPDKCKYPIDVCRPQHQQSRSPEKCCNGDGGEVTAPIPTLLPSVAQVSPITTAPVTTTTCSASIPKRNCAGADPPVRSGGGGGGGGVKAIQDGLLAVFQELCEIARPKIAAEAVVTSACKVGKGPQSKGDGGDRAGYSREAAGLLCSSCV